MKLLLSCLCLFLTAYRSTAQNWQTVLPNDTTYYTAGKLSATDSNARLIRVAWIDLATATPAGNVYSFYKTLRQNDTSSCLDTAGASWLGSRYIRKPDGTEYYFNANGDTITLLTQADTGTSWNITNPTANLVFKGTVTNTGIIQVDGVTDSFKTITIQAYQNNVAVYNWYNNLSLQISKNHGWIKTMDMFRFPDIPDTYGPFGAMTDSTQHTRLPKSFSAMSFDSVGSNKYVPGNEWIYYNSKGNYLAGYSTTITHDSIISVQTLGTGIRSVSFHRDFYKKVPMGSGTFRDTSYSYTGTLSYNAANQQTAAINLQPEVKKMGALTLASWQYYLDTGCNGNPLIKMRSDKPVGYIAQSPNSCPSIVSYGYTTIDKLSQDYLIGFGLLNYTVYSIIGQASYTLYEEDYYTYMKTGACVYGTKVPVPTMGITTASASTSKPAFSIAPNPAFNTITINTGNMQTGTLTITDLTGRNMYRQPISASSTTIPVQDYSAGIYIVHLTTNEGTSASQKLVITK